MYDPLVEAFPKANQTYPNSYWASTVPEKAPYQELNSDVQADVAIIGAGYTGLSAAYHLANTYNKSVVVVDANQPGWGCSGRNAGFVLPGTGRLSLSDMESKWGDDTAKRIFAEYMTSIDTVNQMIETGNIDCDKTLGGYLKLAHRRAKVATLREQANKLSEQYKESVRFVSSKEVGRDFLQATDMYGGIYFDQAFAVNPLKLAHGYCQLAEQAGARLYANSPVVKWQHKSHEHLLYTPNGRVAAEKVLIATNGYTGTGLHKLVRKRHFPVLSSIIVTRPLTQQELTTINLRPGLMAMDTRRMKYYYRLLPDGRILFGGRGALKGKDADKSKHLQRLTDGLHATFPALKQVKADYFWSGWVSASFDNYPRLAGSDDGSIHYAMGYCGSGLAFSSLAGKRLSQLLCEPQSLPDLPFWKSALPRFPFSRFRRVGLAAYYFLAALRD